MKNKFAIAAFVGLLWTGTASAGPVYSLVHESVGVSPAGTITDTNVPAATPPVYLGTYYGDFVPTSSGPAFLGQQINCFAPFIYGSATLYDLVQLASVVGTTKAAWMGALLANAVAPTTPDTTAAREAAMLELSEDLSPHSVLDGNLYVSGLSSAATTLADQEVYNAMNVWTIPANLMAYAFVPDQNGGVGQPFAVVLDPTDVPEPASLALLGAALFGLGLVRHKRA